MTMKLHNIKVYQAKDGWRWRMRAPNGRIVAEGGEAYTRRGRCFRAACNFVDVISANGVVLVSDEPKKAAP